MTLEWNGDEAIQAMREAIAEKLLKAAVVTQTEHMKRLDVQNPPPYKTPAKIGEWPRKRTGFGQSHIFIEPRSKSEIARTLTVRIGYGVSAFYLAILKDKGWKGLTDTLDAIRPQIRAILEG